MKFGFSRSVAGVVAACVSLAIAAPARATIFRTASGYSISDLYVFGDSLSDMAIFRPQPAVPCRLPRWVMLAGVLPMVRTTPIIWRPRWV